LGLCTDAWAPGTIAHLSSPCPSQEGKKGHREKNTDLEPLLTLLSSDGPFLPTGQQDKPEPKHKLHRPLTKGKACKALLPSGERAGFNLMLGPSSPIFSAVHRAPTSKCKTRASHFPGDYDGGRASLKAQDPQFKPQYHPTQKALEY
jgi:hypothetical protein